MCNLKFISSKLLQLSSIINYYNKYLIINNFEIRFSVLKSIEEKKYDEAFRGQLAILHNIVKYLQSSDNENWMVPLANTVRTSRLKKKKEFFKQFCLL